MHLKTVDTDLVLSNNTALVLERGCSKGHFHTRKSFNLSGLCYARAWNPVRYASSLLFSCHVEANNPAAML